MEGVVDAGLDSIVAGVLQICTDVLSAVWADPFGVKVQKLSLGTAPTCPKPQTKRTNVPESKIPRTKGDC